MKLSSLEKSKENRNVFSIDSMIDSSSAISLSVCAVFLAALVMVIGFFLHRRRRSLKSGGPVPVIQQVLSHGSLFSSRCTQTRLAAAQPKSVQIQTTTSTGQCAGAGAVCAVQQQLGQVDRPQAFNKPTAVKSPSSGYLKKSPSPTGQKSPPQLTQVKEQANDQNSFHSDEIFKEGNSISQNMHTDEQLRRGSKQQHDVLGNEQMIKNAEVFNLTTSGGVTSDDTISVGSNVSITTATSITTQISSKDEKDTTIVQQPSSHGKLQFKLKYTYEKHALCVSIMGCYDLIGKGSIDPYVKLQLLPDKTHKVKTKVIRKNNNPVFDEEFTFFGIQPSQLDFISLHFSVLSFDRYSRNEVIGEVIHHLDQTHFDTLDKQVTLVKDILPKGAKLKNHGRGEILISLCHQPAANRLTVVILKAKNLPKMDLTGLSDPYVKINLMHNKQRIAKKKTHVKKRTLNPVYNESFVFDLPVESNASKSGSEPAKSGSSSILDGISLELSLLDYDRVTRNEIIGRLQLSVESEDAAARKHWIEVANSPRKQIAEWHRLSE